MVPLAQFVNVVGDVFPGNTGRAKIAGRQSPVAVATPKINVFGVVVGKQDDVVAQIISEDVAKDLQVFYITP